MGKRYFFLCVLFFSMWCSISASAAELPDLSQSGSITLTSPGGNAILYRVGEIHFSADAIVFLPAGDFTEWNGEFTDLSAPSLAEELAAYAQQHHAAGETGQPSAGGTVLFSNLNPALYLLVQTEAAPGYEPMPPFLVSLPKYESGNYQYHIDATPKFQLKPLPTEPLPSLPQTGQLNWPIPILGIAGSLLCLGGLILQRKHHG